MMTMGRSKSVALHWPYIGAFAFCAALGSSACSSDKDDATGARDAGSSDGAEAGKGGSTGKPASWTAMGKDSSNTYYQPSETKLTVDNAKDLKEHWRITTPGWPAGSPLIVDGKVYITATGGLVAVELKTGRQLWTNTDIKGTSSPAYQDGFLYVHAAANAELFKVKAADGSVVWGPVRTYPENAAADGTSSAIVAGNKVLVGHSTFAEVAGDGRSAAKGGVEAFSTEDGSRAWTYLTTEGDETGAMVWSTVSVDLQAKVVFATTGNNYTVVGPGSDAFHAIDLDTGKRLWVEQVRQNDIWTIFGSNAADPLADTDFGANPILAQTGNTPLVAAGDKAGSFWALKRDTGEVLWSRDKLSATHTPNNGGVLMNGAFDGKNFYVVANEPPSASFLHVLSAADGKDVREPTKFDALTWGAPSLANGLLFVPVATVLHVFNAATGDELTSFDTGGTIAAGAAAIADGYVVVKSGLQYMYASDAKTNREVIAYSLGAAPVQDKPDAGTAASGPSWSNVYEQVIVANGCAGAGLCHGGDGGALRLNDKAGSYKALVGVKAMGTNAIPGSGKNCVDTGLTRVVAGKPDESLLQQKLEGTQTCGSSMPIGAKLPDDQIKLVRDWIAAGAKDD